MSSLQVLGLSDIEAETYQLLVATGATDVPHLASLTRSPAADVTAAVSSLRAKGLVTRLDQDPQRIAPTPPEVALSPLLRNGQEALSEASRRVSELAEQHRANARRRDPDQLVEVLTGSAAIRTAIRNMQLSTRHEMMWFCRAGHVAMPASDNDEEFAMLERGIRYRVIYEQALLEEPGMIDSLADGVRAGEEARAIAQLPVRLAIADRSTALCPLVSVPDGRSEPTAAIVRDSNLLTALIALFESAWSAASPLIMNAAEPASLEQVAPGPTGRGGASSIVDADELELLSLLVGGVTDKAIAARLNISTRTVQRRISDLMALTGAQSRMQLAWQVAQRGWLSPGTARPSVTAPSATAP